MLVPHAFRTMPPGDCAQALPNEQKPPALDRLREGRQRLTSWAVYPETRWKSLRKHPSTTIFISFFKFKTHICALAYAVK